MSKILIIEDEEAIADLEKDYLELSGFQVEIENDGEKGLEAAMNGSFDLIILDLMLPGLDGFEICRRIRDEKNIPILMVSAKKDDIDKIRGLGLGADDYMTKPFLPRELVLRITAILRRTWFPPARTQEREGLLRLGKKSVDFNAGTVTDGEESCTLTAKELAILKKLYENRGNIVTFDILCNTVWGDEYYGYENTLMVHIRRLREKIEENPSKPEWLLTVRGLGYRLAKEHSSKERAL